VSRTVLNQTQHQPQRRPARITLLSIFFTEAGSCAADQESGSKDVIEGTGECDASKRAGDPALPSQSIIHEDVICTVRACWWRADGRRGMEACGDFGAPAYQLYSY
jgi:hypothetical protein